MVLLIFNFLLSLDQSESFVVVPVLFLSGLGCLRIRLLPFSSLSTFLATFFSSMIVISLFRFLVELVPIFSCHSRTEESIRVFCIFAWQFLMRVWFRNQINLVSSRTRYWWNRSMTSSPMSTIPPISISNQRT